MVPGTDDQQYIHWQRCLGLKQWPSSYGKTSDGISGNLDGMGPAGEEVTADQGSAVIFVEIAYGHLEK